MINITYREEFKSNKLDSLFILYKEKVEKVKIDKAEIINSGNSEILIHLSDILPCFYFASSNKDTEHNVFNELMDSLKNAMTESVNEIGANNIQNMYFL